MQFIQKQLTTLKCACGWFKQITFTLTINQAWADSVPPFISTICLAKVDTLVLFHEVFISCMLLLCRYCAGLQTTMILASCWEFAPVESGRLGNQLYFFCQLYFFSIEGLHYFAAAGAGLQIILNLLWTSSSQGNCNCWRGLACKVTASSVTKVQGPYCTCSDCMWTDKKNYIVKCNHYGANDVLSTVMTQVIICFYANQVF